MNRLGIEGGSEKIHAVVFQHLIRHLAQDHMGNENRDPDGDGAVRHVEGRPVMGSHVEIEKIDHLPETQAIDEVAHGTAENHGQGRGQKRARFGRQAIEINDHPHGKGRHADEQQVPQVRVAGGHEAEGASRVVDMGQVEESRDDLDALVKGQTV
ncbi:hypothetical protein DESC_70005 [Desulfosarcina cetonica]|nr:hypothetical protein DESC_70005 [Desulfosarcina cetonica]